MQHFHRAFLWRLLIACGLLAALVALGGHLVATGRLSAPQGPGANQRVALIALGSGLATAAFLYPLLVNLHRKVFRFADDVVTGNLELASVIGAAIAQRDSETGDHNFRVTLYAFRRIAGEAFQAIHAASESELQDLLTVLVERHRPELYQAEPLRPSVRQ